MPPKKSPTKRDAIVAILAALPALIVAVASLISAEATKASEKSTYQNAAETIGYQAEDIMHLEARILALEYTIAGGKVDIHSNTFNTGGGTGVGISPRLPGGPRDPRYFP
jgi:hypothetical protein